MICPECKSEVPDITDVCGKCGFEFTGESKTSEAPTATPDVDEKSRPDYKQKYHEAVHAYEQGAYEECLKLCDLGIEQFEDTSDFRRVRHYAAQNVKESKDNDSTADSPDAKPPAAKLEFDGDEKESPEYKQKYQNALRAFENEAYEKCLEVCDRAIELFHDPGEFQKIRFQASLKATESEYRDNVISTHHEKLESYEQQKQLENDAIVAFEMGDFKKCVDLCEQGLEKSDGGSEFTSLKHQASLKLMEAEYQKEESAAAGPKEDRVGQLRRIEDAATAAFEEQEYERCIEISGQVANLRMESPRCNELESSASSRITELEEKLSLCEFYFQQENWNSVEETCTRVLEIKSANTHAQNMLETARNRIEKKQRVQVASGWVVVAILGLLLVVGGIWSSISKGGGQSSAQERYDHYYNSAKKFQMKAKELTRVNGLTALKFLVEAKEQIAYAKEEDILDQVDAKRRSEFVALDADIRRLLVSVEKAHELYEIRIRQVKKLLIEAERFKKREPSKSRKFYLKALNQLADICAPKVIDLLETPRQQEINRLRDELEKRYRAFVFEPILNTKAKGIRMKLQQAETFIHGDLLLSKAEDAFKNKKYDQSAKFLERAESSFKETVSAAYRTIQLHHYRDSYFERSNTVDMEKLERVAPEKSGRIRQLQVSADESIESNDYVAAIKYYATAAKLLDEAEKYLKEH